MKKKGFTLIELLAVIVILAIITVIAVPKILDVIDKSRKQTFTDGVKLIESGIKTQLSSSELTVESSFTKGDDNCYLFDFTNKNNNYNELKVKNKENYSGEIKYCDNKFTYNGFTDKQYVINTENGVEIIKKVDSSLNPDTETSETKYYEMESLISPVSSNTNDLGTITSDTIFGTQHDNYYAFNGIARDSDKWLNRNPASGWLKWNFTENKRISKFYIHGSDMQTRTPKTVELFGSNDDINYVSLASSELNQMGVTYSKEIIVPKEKQDYYKYYKWNFGSNYGDSSGIAVGEIKVYTITKYELGKGDVKITPSYLTSNDSLTADSIFSSHNPYYVFDGNISSKWLNQNTTSGWLTRKFDIDVKISEFKIYGTDVPSRTPRTVELLGSNDGENYVSLVNSGLDQMGTKNSKEITVPSENQNYYKYYKWKFGSNYGGDYGIAIGEIELTTYIR